LDLNLGVVEIRPLAVRRWVTYEAIRSFSYAGVNRIRFEGIVSVHICGETSQTVLGHP